MVEFHQILRLLNTEPNRPRASPAIFKHVGQVPYEGLQIWGKGAYQNFGPFWPSGPVWSNFIKFYVFSTQSLINLGPRLQFLSM